MKTVPWIIIVILLLLLFLQRECNTHQPCPECPEIVFDTIHDSVSYPVTIYVPKPIYKDTGTTKWRYHKIDTSQILADYFSKNFYLDTLLNDTNALIIIADTITRNKITYRLPTINIFPHTITQTTYIKNNLTPNRKLFIGAGIGRNINQFGLSPSLMYITKKENAYTISYDILNKDICFTIFWKVKFK